MTKSIEAGIAQILEELTLLRNEVAATARGDAASEERKDGPVP